MKTNQCGSYVPCRAILDSASQLNPIASNGVEQSSSTSCEIGDGSIQVNTSVDIDIKSRNNWFSATFNVMEFIADLPERRHNVPVVTPLSNSSVQCKYQSSYPRIKLIFLYLQILLWTSKKELSGSSKIFRWYISPSLSRRHWTATGPFPHPANYIHWRHSYVQMMVDSSWRTSPAILFKLWCAAPCHSTQTASIYKCYDTSFSLKKKKK